MSTSQSFRGFVHYMDVIEMDTERDCTGTAENKASYTQSAHVHPLGRGDLGGRRSARI